MKEDELVYEEESVLDEDEDMLNEEQLNSLDPWEIAFEEGVRQAEEGNFDDEFDDDVE